MRTLTDYLQLVPNYNASKPNFIAMLTTYLEPLIQLGDLCNNLSSYFDLDTAIGVQLDQVGLWIGISRNISVPITGVFFTLDTEGLGVDQGILLGPFTPTQGIIALDDYHYRFLLYGKVAANSWDGSAGKANAAYALAFQNTGASIRVQDNQNMTFTVYIMNSNSLSALQKAIITGGYLQLKPEGVAVSYVFM